MKRLCLLLFTLLLTSSLLAACEEKTTGPKTEYVLPAEITRGDGNGGYTSYKLTYDGDELRIGSIDGSYRLLCCDSAGRLIKDTNCTPNGNVISVTVYEYDENGNLTEKRRQVRGGSTFRDVYTYDERGNQLSLKQYESDGKPWILYEVAYDESGREIERIYYNADGSTEIRRVTAYDENGNETATVSYDADGNELAKNEYTYDENGRMHTWLRSNSGTFSFRQEYSYDENGNLLQTLGYGEDGAYSVVETYVYDENGNVVEYLRYDIEGEPYLRRIYTYDERGNVTEEAIFQPPETLIQTYLYTFDDDSYPTGRTVQHADGSEKISWQVTETVTALASEVQAAFYRDCIELYAIPQYME